MKKAEESFTGQMGQREAVRLIFKNKDDILFQ